DTKNMLLFVASQNEVLLNAVESSNASYGTLSDEAIEKKLISIDSDWESKGWSEHENFLTKSAAAQVLNDLARTSMMPFVEMAVTDIKGGLVAATAKTDDFYQADEEWWQAAYKGGLGTFYLSTNIDSEEGQSPFFSLSCPIINKNGMTAGILRLVIEKERFFRPIFDVYFGKGSYAGVVTGAGANVYNSYAGEISPAVFKTFFDAVVSNSSTGKKIFKVNGLGNIFLGFSRIEGAWFSSGSSWYVYCLKSSKLALAPLNRTAGYLCLVWLFEMFCLYGLTIFFSRKFVEPLEYFKKACESVKRGKLESNLKIASGDEFEELAADFNEMISELRQSTVSKEYFNKIIQNMSDILFVVNPFGVIDLANKRASELLGYDEEELKGKEAIQIFSKKDRYVISWGLKGLIEEGALKDKKISLVTKTRKEIEVYLGTRSIRDSAGNLMGLVCLAKDMTEITRLLNDLQRSNEEIERHKDELERSLKELTENRDVMLSILEDTDESKKQLEETLRKLKETQNELLHAEKMISLGQIAAGVAHEINNPLFVISGEAEMLHMDKALSAGARDSIKTIREQVDRIGDIIKRLLEFSRKKEVKFALIDLNSVADKSIDLLKYQAKTFSSVEIVNKLSKDPLFVQGDINQLHEVFVNILLNGIQAMEENGGPLTLSSYIEIIKNRTGKYEEGRKLAVIQIKDKGVGMDEETKKRIFDPFFTTKKNGIGLGLAVCFGIIENHNGTIDVESRPGEGTTFSVKLPLSK
ncbi:MAG TPA: ATP-binding protein, partial [Candidatus Omnitrophota bacterium]|nr:ATP-binding protein [Candidatus Omnitrophota bacterium]